MRKTKQMKSQDHGPMTSIMLPVCINSGSLFLDFNTVSFDDTLKWFKITKSLSFRFEV